MNELNQKIKDLETKILNDELFLNKTKRTHALATLTGITELEKGYKETKNPAFSTAAKREAEVSTFKAISELKEDIDSMDNSIKTDKIELRFLEREFKIRLRN